MQQSTVKYKTHLIRTTQINCESCFLNGRVDHNAQAVPKKDVCSVPIGITQDYLEDEKLKILKGECTAHIVPSRKSRDALVKNLRRHYRDYHMVFYT